MTSGLVIHRGECGEGIDSSLTSIVKGLLKEAEEVVSEPDQVPQPKTTGYVN